ncbi:Hypothetical predicted protein [Podarcis lilfordi]|uniref:Uncharacterized protein n=1 Tax=Podarcis lilfordi TaxID=74358 RepID=A0AA35JYS7_9SAUR|nr:Hypothetical predicted protein [Podarcis lilfordi]
MAVEQADRSPSLTLQLQAVPDESKDPEMKMEPEVLQGLKEATGAGDSSPDSQSAASGVPKRWEELQRVKQEPGEGLPCRPLTLARATHRCQKPCHGVKARTPCPAARGQRPSARGLKNRARMGSFLSTEQPSRLMGGRAPLVMSDQR